MVQSNPSLSIEILQFLFPKQIINCPTDPNRGPFTISGSVIGLENASLTVQSGTTPNETITIQPGQKSYQFQTRFPRNTSYQITVSSIPFGDCFLENGQGSLGKNITDANIRCVEPRSVSNLAGWYRIDSFSQADSTAVGTWTDESTNGNNLTGFGPLYHTSGMNGKPEVRILNDSVSTSAATGIGGSELTVFLVMRRLGFNATEQYVFFMGNDAGGCPAGSVVMSLQAGDGQVGLQTPCSGYYLSPSINFAIAETDFSPKLIVIRYGFGAPSTIFAKENGQVKVNTTLVGAGLNGSNLYFQFGDYGAGTRPAQVAISEYLYFNRVLSDAELLRIECYLAKKFSFSYGQSCQP